jgi:RHS repeat-associated protein
VAVGGNTDTYTYNGIGQRVRKVEGGTTYNYTLASNRIDASILSDGAADYTYGRGLIGEKRSSTDKFYHTDLLGTARAISNSSGTKTDSLDTDGFGLTVTSSGTTPTPFGFASRYRYQEDSTGLMRLGHRYYDASTGRFLSRDPIRDGYNWYTYCDNQPTNAVDPDGLGLIHVAIVLLLVVVVVVVAATVIHDNQTPPTIINDTSEPIRVVVEDAGEQVAIELPPNYQTNPDEVDADHVFLPGSPPNSAAHYQGRPPWQESEDIHISNPRPPDKTVPGTVGGESGWPLRKPKPGWIVPVK